MPRNRRQASAPFSGLTRAGGMWEWAGDSHRRGFHGVQLCITQVPKGSRIDFPWRWGFIAPGRIPVRSSHALRPTSGRATQEVVQVILDAERCGPFGERGRGLLLPGMLTWDATGLPRGPSRWPLSTAKLLPADATGLPRGASRWPLPWDSSPGGGPFCRGQPNDPRGKPVGFQPGPGCWVEASPTIHGASPWDSSSGPGRWVEASPTIHGASPWDFSSQRAQRRTGLSQPRDLVPVLAALHIFSRVPSG